MKKLKFKFGAASVAFTAVVIAIVILFNGIIVAISGETPFKIDLTREKIYEFSKQTEKIIDNIDEEINVYALYPDNQTNDYIEYVKEYLLKYSALNKNISVKYIDPYQNPSFAKKYQETGTTIDAGAIIVESGSKFKVVQLNELYTMSKVTGAISINMEKQMSQAFAYVTGQTSESKIYFTQGHDEYVATNLMELLSGEDSVCETINISMNKIPEDTDLLVITAPALDFTAEEIKEIDYYIEDGGKLLYFTIPGTIGLEKIEGYLKEWGLIINNSIVVEENMDYAYATNSGFAVPAPKIIEHEITQTIKDANLVYMAPYPAAMTVSQSNEKRADSQILLSTTKDSYFEENGQKTYGPFAVSALAGNMSGGRVGVLTSLHSIEYSGMLDEPSYANEDFILNFVSFLTERQNPLEIRAKEVSDSRLVMNNTQIAICYFALQYFVPITIILVGLIVWIKRRYR